MQGTDCADVLVAPPSADTVYGGAGDDRIYAPGSVQAVIGGGGDDVLYGHAPQALAADCPAGCHLGLGSQTFDGGPGNDVVYGERGNDVLDGNGGEDRLYGGIGDDTVLGGADGDLVSGGWGADTVDGEAGDDYVRGDGTADELIDSGGGTDTLSYATGVTPGFPNRPGSPTPWAGYSNFPGEGGERGVHVDLGQSIGDNNQARFGGGFDTGLAGGDFENVIGTPFSDYIVGSTGANTIHGGGGGDVILGGDGGDTIHGGADGDHLDGGAEADTVDGDAGSDHCVNATATNCEAANTGGVVLRDPSKISVGLLAPAHPGSSHVYLSGSNLPDNVTATYSPGPPATVTFTAAGSTFDQSAAAAGGCSTTPSQAVCTLSKPLDAIVLYGAPGNDGLQAVSFPSSTSVILVGGPGGDSLTGGSASEDLLVDDPTAQAAGADDLSGLGGDDALLNNEGLDQVDGGDGNDLFLSASVCDGDALDGGAGTDNGSWARLLGTGVEARIAEGSSGRPGSGSGPSCGAAPEQLDALANIEDLEGSGQADQLYGGAGPNNLLGWGGGDLFRARAGDDKVFANSGDTDPQILCGDGLDRALLDHEPQHDDSVAVDCEIFEEADPVTYAFTVEPLEQPTFTGTDPPSPANDNFPEVLGSAVAGSSVRLYTSPSCSEASLAATGTADEFASPGITVPVPGNSTTALYATARSADSGSPCSTASVSYTESSPPEDPVAVDDAATVAEDSGPTPIDVLANDQDPDGGEMTILTTSPPSFGTVAITGGGSGLTYAPAPDRCGPTSFAYTLNGGSTATVSVAVTCAPEPPRRVFRCAGIRTTRHGSPRRDVINGTPRRDVIAAFGGNDLVRGRGGNDLICGGRGRDTLLGGAGRDRLLGGPGRDRTRQ